MLDVIGIGTPSNGFHTFCTIFPLFVTLFELRWCFFRHPFIRKIYWTLVQCCCKLSCRVRANGDNGKIATGKAYWVRLNDLRPSKYLTFKKGHFKLLPEKKISFFGNEDCLHSLEMKTQMWQSRI